MQDHELKDALQGSTTEVTVAGRKLTLHKWTWRQSLSHGDKFIGAIAEVVKGKSIADLMKQDVLQVLRNQAEVMAGILVDTIYRENFSSRDEASAWFETIAMDDAVTLLGHVMRLNYVPLRSAFGELKRVVLEGSGDQKSTATQQPT